MNVLGIYYKHKPGGFCKRLYRSYEALAQAGHQVHYVSTEVLPVRQKSIVPHVIKLPFKDANSILFWFVFTLYAMLYVCYLTKKLNIATVFVMGSYYAFVNGLNKMLNKAILVTYLHARDTEYSRLIGRRSLLISFQAWYEYISFSISDIILTINSKLKENLENRYPHSRIEILPNNIELPEMSGSDFRKEIHAAAGTFLIATSGVFTKGKNIDLLIKAFFRAQLDNALLIMIGDVSVRDLHEKKKLERLVESLELSETVIFTGWRMDACDIVKSADLFVLPSLSEGCPLALLEALGLGVPCLGSRIPEVREVLHYEELLFDPANEKELTHKLLSCKDQKTWALWQELCEERRAVYTFDWDKRFLDSLRRARIGV
jgi:glycosyltransferase involved in cell wall biosynthesis